MRLLLNYTMFLSLLSKRCLMSRGIFVQGFLTSRTRMISPLASNSPFILKRNLSTATSLNLRYERTEEDEKFDSFLKETTSTDDFFADADRFPSFNSIGIQSQVLLDRLENMLPNKDNFRPSAVQAASFAAISSGKDVSIGAETGSGKTLAYLLPIIDDILKRKREARNEDGSIGHLGYDYARAIILVPNKELASQVLRMASELTGGVRSIIWDTNGENIMLSHDEEPIEECDIVRLGIFPGNLKSPEDYKPIRLSVNEPMDNPPLDIIIATPAALGPIGVNPKNINMFADIQTIVIDEADMLLDGGYLRPLNDVLLGFKRADKLDVSFGVVKTQHVLVAATLPDMGLKSAQAYVQRKFPYATRVTMKGMHNARHYGLKDQTIWIQDDYDEEMPKKKRMECLIEILKRSPSEATDADDREDGVGLAGEKVMIFLNSVNDVDSATAALTRAGVNAVPFHAKVSLSERTENLKRFRNYDPNASMSDPDAVPVLVCTDLAARGLDISGVTSVVQLQFAGNVVSHLHRMGRCGRAGNRDGKGVVFYGGVESELVDVVRQAEDEQQTMVLEGNEIDDNESESGGKVQNAFSRKRGFTKKRKKIARKQQYDTEF